jgi:hypothetical protein
MAIAFCRAWCLLGRVFVAALYWPFLVALTKNSTCSVAFTYSCSKTISGSCQVIRQEYKDLEKTSTPERATVLLLRANGFLVSQIKEERKTVY